MVANRMSRRDFLKIAGVTIGATAFTSCGLGDSVAKTPQAQKALDIDTPSFHYGKDDPMNERILVTYATRTGSTVGVASAIGETFAARGFAVDVKPIQENPTIDGYRSIVMGSAVNGAKWLPEAVEFVKNNQEKLNQVPVVLFSVHIMNLGDDEKSKENRLAYLNDVRPLLRASAEVFFAGIGMEPDEQSWLTRWAYRTFKIGLEGDCRDWNKIRTWAQTVEI